MSAKKTEKTPEQAKKDADHVESGPSDPFDIFASDQFANDDSQEEVQLKEEEELERLEEAVDSGLYEDVEIVDDNSSKSGEKEGDDSDDEEEEDDEEAGRADEEDEEDEEDEDEEQEDEEDEEEPEEETELVKSLKQQIASQDGVLQNLQAQMQELLKAKASPKEEADPEEDLKPVFNIGAPDKVVAAFASGEPDQIREAVQIITNGTAEIVRRQVLKEGREVLEKTLETERGKIKAMTALEKEKSAIHEDFYGTYPGYATPEIQQLVASTATQYVARTPGATWGPVMKKAVADAVAGIVKFDGKANPAKASRNRGRKASKKTEASAETKGSKTKSKGKKKSAGSRPPRQVKAGTRVADAVAQRKDRQSEIADTFVGFRG